MEERRLEGGRLLKSGKLSQAEIARHLGVSRATVSNWAKTIEAQGIRGLRKKKAAGSPSKLNARQKQKLKSLLDRGVLASGFPTDRWHVSMPQPAPFCKHPFIIHILQILAMI